MRENSCEKAFFSRHRKLLRIEITTLNCFAVKTQKLMGAPFLFELVAVVS